MSDIDIIVNDFSDLIANLLKVSAKRNPYNNGMIPTSLINVSFNVKAHSLEEMLSNNLQEKLCQYHEGKDPLIDVIETTDQIRVIATLPGIKNEDVWFDVRNGVLTVEIIRYGQILKKEIQCKTKPEQVLIKSSKVNNSVLELVFDKV